MQLCYCCGSWLTGILWWSLSQVRAHKAHNILISIHVVVPLVELNLVQCLSADFPDHARMVFRVALHGIRFSAALEDADSDLRYAQSRMRQGDWTIASSCGTSLLEWSSCFRGMDITQMINCYSCAWGRFAIGGIEVKDLTEDVCSASLLQRMPERVAWKRCGHRAVLQRHFQVQCSPGIEIPHW
jgi:hypothetical protein